MAIATPVINPIEVLGGKGIGLIKTLKIPRKF